MSLPLPDEISHRSTVSPDFGMEVDATGDGGVPVRALFAASRYRLDIIWESVTDIQRRTVESALRAPQSWTVTLCGQAYTARMTEPPAVTRVAPNRYTIAAAFAGVRT